MLQQLILDFYNETYYERDNVRLSEDTLLSLWSLTTSLFLVGGMFGSLLGGWLADAIGRYVTGVGFLVAPLARCEARLK